MGNDCKPKQFSQADQEKMIANLIEPMANDALRTICIAYKDFVTGILSSLRSHICSRQKLHSCRAFISLWIVP